MAAYADSPEFQTRSNPYAPNEKTPPPARLSVKDLKRQLTKLKVQHKTKILADILNSRVIVDRLFFCS